MKKLLFLAALILTICALTTRASATTTTCIATCNAYVDGCMQACGSTSAQRNQNQGCTAECLETHLQCDDNCYNAGNPFGNEGQPFNQDPCTNALDACSAECTRAFGANDAPCNDRCSTQWQGSSCG